MPWPRRSLGSLVLLLPLVPLLGACQGFSVPGGQGEGVLQIVVTTDLAVPKDFDSLGLVVMDGSQELYRRFERLESARPTKVRLPQVFPVRATIPKGGRIHVAAIASQRGTPVLLSEADVPFPVGQTRSVTLPLQFLCRGAASIASVTPKGNPIGACGNGLTCKAGACVSAQQELGPEAMDSSMGDGGEGTSFSSKTCFDPIACFEGVPPSTILPTTCSIPVPSGDPTRLRVGLVPREPNVGSCSPSGRCFVPLEVGPEPYQAQLQGGRLSLPKAVCSGAVTAVVVSSSCQGEPSRAPLCPFESDNEASPGRDPTATPPSGELPDDGGQEDGGAANEPPPEGLRDDGGNADGGSPTNPPSDASTLDGYVAGTITGLHAKGLLLRLNRRAELSVEEGQTRFAFPKPIGLGDVFTVVVASQPDGLYCSVATGKGTQGGGREGKVRVDCEPSPKVLQVGAGNSHTCALLENQTVRCWGDHTYGQTGGGTLSNSVPGLNEVTAIAVGYFHTCALRSKGTLRCWGDNYYGQTAGGSKDTDIPGLSGIKALAAGFTHTCTVLSSGALRCWGQNYYGQTAGGSKDADIPGLSGVAAVTAGDGHTCAVLAKGALRCWGKNSFGQTAGGSLDADLPGIEGVTAVAAGQNHTCALFGSGTVHCWGNNADGQCAGSSLNSLIVGLSGVVAITAGESHTCARMMDLTVRCWGKDTSGQVGDTTPFRSLEGLTGTVTIAAGAGHSCATFQDGTVHCWGDNFYGQVTGTKPGPIINVPLAP